MKRFLSTLMLIVFTIVSLAVVPASAATTFSDIENDKSTLEAVTVLSKLGVINGYEESDGSFTFRPDNNVTRAEFTAMLLRTRGLGSVGSASLENPPFPDVTDPSVSWAIANIRTARDMKIINGYDDGTFKPNNTVTYEEAIKMIVCALGYGEMGTTVEGSAWYAKYLTTATQLKFLEGAGGQIGVPATRATIAKMLYNCLEVKLAESNEITEKTILEADLGLTKSTGFIASNPEISLSAPDANLRADEIQITAVNADGDMETLTYKVDNMEDYADMLGAQITFYYKADRSTSTNTLIMATVEKSVTLEVAADLIEYDECTPSSLVYYESENASRTSSARIASDSIVVYNGQLYGKNDKESTYEIYCSEMGEDALPQIGMVKLLDRDGDKAYDIVFVDSYDAYIASSVTSSTKTIVDNNLRKGLTNNKLVIDPDDLSKTVKIVDEDGKAVAFSSIKTGSVICVKASNPENGGDQVLTAVVCNDTVTGTVKGVNSDGSIKVDSKTYKFSAMAPWVNPVEEDEKVADAVMTEPQMGDSGKFYLDMNGNIIGYDKTEQATNQQYAYLMSVGIDDSDGFNERLVLRFITQSGNKQSYYTYEKTKVNGETFSNYEGILNALADEANPSGEGVYPVPSKEEDPEFDVKTNHKYSQLVKFTTKSSKGEVVVDEIITVTDETFVTSGGDTSADELFFYKAMKVGDKVTYKSTNKQMVGDKKININNATIFNIPKDRSDVDKYKKMSLGDLKKDEAYIVEFYDVSSTNSAKIVLVYGGASTAGEVRADSPVMVITEIGQEIDDNGETRYRLYGYVGSTAVDYWGSLESKAEDVLETLQEGDVVRLGTDDEGYYTVKEEHIIFSVADGYWNTAVKAEPDADVYPKEAYNTSGNLAYRVIWGSAYQYDKEDGIFVMTTKVLEGDEAADAVDNERYDMQISWFKNAKIYEFDTTGSSLDITEYETSENESVLEALQLYDGSTTPDEVFIHMTGLSTVKTVIIVKR